MLRNGVVATCSLLSSQRVGGRFEVRTVAVTRAVTRDSSKRSGTVGDVTRGESLCRASARASAWVRCTVLAETIPTTRGIVAAVVSNTSVGRVAYHSLVTVVATSTILFVSRST